MVYYRGTVVGHTELSSDFASVEKVIDQCTSAILQARDSKKAILVNLQTLQILPGDGFFSILTAEDQIHFGK